MPVLMAFKDEINYKKIREIKQKELKTKDIIHIDPEFYSATIDHTKILQEEYNKKYLESPTSTEARLLNHEICELEKTLNDIYKLRERKIVLSATDLSIKPNFKNMLDHEHELFEMVFKNLNEKREMVFNQTLQPFCAGTDHPKISQTQSPQAAATTHNTTSNTTMATSTSDNAQPEDVMQSQVEDQPEEQTQEPPSNQPQESPSEPDNDHNEAVLDNTNRVLVHVLDDLEPFVGTDEITYELNKEDIVTIPKDIANILLKKDKIKIVEPTI